MEQLNIFDYINQDYKITKPIRLIELFAGIGSQAKALKNIGANFEHYRVVEFDKHALKSYNSVHCTDFETSDITQIHASDLCIVDTHKYEYIMTYSFPCQDLSLAGKGKGMEKGSGTRSGLLWEVERILNECDELPQVLLMENVPQVHGKKNIDHFNQWIKALEDLGYQNYWKDLNAKDFGIPQNRNRTFMVSILGGGKYEFPKPFELKLRLKDMLEDEVDEKYFLSEKMMKYIVADNEKWTGNNNKSLINKSIASTINTGEGTRRCDASNYISKDVGENCNIKEVMNLYEMGIKQYNRRTGSVVDTDAISSTLLARTQGDNNLIIVDDLENDKHVECLHINNATKKGYLEAYEGDGINISTRMQYHRGNVQHGMIQTLDTQPTKGVVVKDEPKK